MTNTSKTGPVEREVGREITADAAQARRERREAEADGRVDPNPSEVHPGERSITGPRVASVEYLGDLAEADPEGFGVYDPSKSPGQVDRTRNALPSMSSARRNARSRGVPAEEIDDAAAWLRENAAALK